MNFKTYEIVLQTNDERTDVYYKRAFNKEQAVILAQAEAIESAEGYGLVRAREI